MLRGPDAQSHKFLTDLADITRRMDRAQRQISSGKRLNTISDDPDQVPQLLELRSRLSSVEQIRLNLGRIRNEVDTAESSLRTAATVLDRALTLGTQGATDIADANSRYALYLEVEALAEQMKNIANTQVEGRYIFAGDADQTQPYTIDLTLDDPYSTFQGTPSTRVAQHPAGTRFPIAKTAEQIFDDPDPSKNVFDAINGLRLALRDNDVDAVRSSVATVRSAATHLNNQLAFYGATQNQVIEATDFTFRMEVQAKEQISRIQDADVTAAILDLQEARFQQDAALNAQALKPKQSLFDYLG